MREMAYGMAVPVHPWSLFFPLSLPTTVVGDQASGFIFLVCRDTRAPKINRKKNAGRISGLRSLCLWFVQSSRQSAPRQAKSQKALPIPSPWKEVSIPHSPCVEGTSCTARRCAACYLCASTLIGLECSHILSPLLLLSFKGYGTMGGSIVFFFFGILSFFFVHYFCFKSANIAGDWEPAM